MAKPTQYNTDVRRAVAEFLTVFRDKFGLNQAGALAVFNYRAESSRPTPITNADLGVLDKSSYDRNAKQVHPSKILVRMLEGIREIKTAHNCVLSEKMKLWKNWVVGDGQAATDRLIEALEKGRNYWPIPVEEPPRRKTASGVGAKVSRGRSVAAQLGVMELLFSTRVAGQNQIKPDDTGNYHIGLNLRLFFGAAETEFFDASTGEEYGADCWIVNGRLELTRATEIIPEESISGFAALKTVGGLMLNYMPAPVNGAPGWNITHADKSKRHETLPNTIIYDLCDMMGAIDGTAVMRLFLTQSSIKVNLFDSDELDKSKAYEIKQAIKEQILADALLELCTEGTSMPGEIANCQVRLSHEN